MDVAPCADETNNAIRTPCGTVKWVGKKGEAGDLAEKTVSQVKNGLLTKIAPAAPTVPNNIMLNKQYE
eukprot:scaffold601_cov170-Ochromonas_danica.AAC.22